MEIVVEIESDGQRVKRQRLPMGRHIVGNGAALGLRFPTVSRTHGAIEVFAQKVTFTDLGSRNGSYLDGDSKRIATKIPLEWQQGTLLRIGPFALRWIRPRTDHGLSPNDPHTLLLDLSDQYERLLSESPLLALEQLRKKAELTTEHGESAKLDEVLEAVHHEFHGDGPLRSYLADPRCREVLANAHDELYVDMGSGLKRLQDGFVSARTYQSWAERTAHHSGRRLDLQNPVCEATLANGSRFHAVMSPVSARGLSVAIRRFGSAPLDEQTALRTGWIDSQALTIMKDAITRKLNVVISGGTSTGKTSLLNFLCQYLAPTERVLTVEDTVELSPPIENLVQLQARKPNADGVGEISLRHLVQCALRMRPDRIIVGECRGSEVLEMLQALNTGHPGSLTTVHSNSTNEALHRLELLALLGATNLSVECIKEWINATIDLVIQVERDSSGHRHISEISSRHQNKGFEVIYVRPTHAMAPTRG